MFPARRVSDPEERAKEEARNKERGRTLISWSIIDSSGETVHVPTLTTTPTNRLPGFASPNRRIKSTALLIDPSDKSHTIGCTDPVEKPFINATPSSPLRTAAKTVYPFSAKRPTVSLPTTPSAIATKTAGRHPFPTSTRASTFGGIPPRSQSEVYSA